MLLLFNSASICNVYELDFITRFDSYKNQEHSHSDYISDLHYVTTSSCKAYLDIEDNQIVRYSLQGVMPVSFQNEEESGPKSYLKHERFYTFIHNGKDEYFENKNLFTNKALKLKYENTNLDNPYMGSHWNNYISSFNYILPFLEQHQIDLQDKSHLQNIWRIDTSDEGYVLIYNQTNIIRSYKILLDKIEMTRESQIEFVDEQPFLKYMYLDVGAGQFTIEAINIKRVEDQKKIEEVFVIPEDAIVENASL